MNADKHGFKGSKSDATGLLGLLRISASRRAVAAGRISDFRLGRPLFIRRSLGLLRLRAGLQTAVLHSALFLFSAWLTTGCVPLRFTTSPGATGRIVDVSTHTPVSGAEIVISHSTYPPESPEKAFVNNRPPVVMTGEAGQFAVPLERRLDLFFAPIDFFPRFGLLVIRCQGYETTCVPFWSRSVADLGEIDVKRR